MAYQPEDEEDQKSETTGKSGDDVPNGDVTVDVEGQEEPEEDPWNAAFKTKTKIITPWRGKQKSGASIHVMCM